MVFLYVGIEVGIPNVANLYMTSADGLGMATGVAGTIVGAYWFLMLCGRLIGGAIGAKVSSRTMMTVVSSVAILFILAGMFLPSSMTMSLLGANVPVAMLFFVLCGLCTSVMWGAIFNLAVEGLGKYTSIASGLFMVMVCGGGIVPLVQGAVADFAGYINSYWVNYMLWANAFVFAQTKLFNTIGFIYKVATISITCVPNTSLPELPHIIVLTKVLTKHS